MEFIPIESCTIKTKKKGKFVKKAKNLEENEDPTDTKVLKKEKVKVQVKISKKKDEKKVKNQFRQNILEKKKIAASKKNKKKLNKQKKGENTETKDDQQEDDEEEEEEIMDVSEENEKDEEEEEEEGEQEEDDSDQKTADKALEKKRKELDEKKKNRLFINLKKKIHSDGQIKELHPDIRSVIFPRKKGSRWCWAVFASEERANEALKVLIKKKDIIASKPNPREKVEIRLKKKIKAVQRKKEARQKLKKMWC